MRISKQTLMITAVMAAVSNFSTPVLAKQVEASKVGRVFNPGESQAFWAAMPRPASIGGIPGFQFPQAPGVVDIPAVPNGQGEGETHVTYLSTSPTNGKFAARIVAPNGDVINYPPVDLTGLQPTLFGMELWNGSFPQSWQAGTTRFEVYVQQGSQISMAVGFVNFHGGNPFPIYIGDIAAAGTSPNLSLVLVGAGGQLQPGATAMVAGYIPVQEFSADPNSGNLILTLPGNSWLNEGTTTVTFCSGGNCRTASFEYSVVPSTGKG